MIDRYREIGVGSSILFLFFPPSFPFLSNDLIGLSLSTKFKIKTHLLGLEMAIIENEAKFCLEKNPLRT